MPWPRRFVHGPAKMPGMRRNVHAAALVTGGCGRIARVRAYVDSTRDSTRVGAPNSGQRMLSGVVVWFVGGSRDF